MSDLALRRSLSEDGNFESEALTALSLSASSLRCAGNEEDSWTCSSRRGSSSSGGTVRGRPLMHSPASDSLPSSQSSTMQGILASREAEGGRASPPCRGGSSPTCSSSGGSVRTAQPEGSAEEQQQLLRQEIAFNALGEQVASRTFSLSRSSRSPGAAGSLPSVEIETHTSSTSSGNSGVWLPTEGELRAPHTALPPLSASVASAGGAPPLAAPGGGVGAGGGGGALRTAGEAESQPSSFASAVRGGLERLMRFSNWPNRDAAEQQQQQQ
ncbi:uncharacterized protein LOC113146592, partial [Cyclospora cayetanensis]|uniref:Uncharacterized protein LOC113146592 n=1 Tax=Cyclospora cayetanensis TaxID=88456 RepID=A0A6P6RRN2_9EIME